MAFKLLTQDEQDEITALFLHAQERDLFCHQINQARYAQILATAPDGAFKQRIQTLQDETTSRIDEVNRIIDASALPDNATLQAALDRAQQKILDGQKTVVVTQAAAAIPANP